jgi:hypothetical protein
MGTEQVSWKSATWKELAVRVMGAAAGLLILATVVAKLAGVEFRGVLSFLNNSGIWILSLPVVGLFAIFRHGSWTGWKVVESSTLLSAFFWFGWAGGLVVGVVELFAGR